MYKKKNHEVSYELDFEKNNEQINVIPIDTRVSSLTEALKKPYTPQYSGDIVDASYDGLMSHVLHYKDSKTNVDKGKESLTYLQELEKHRKDSKENPDFNLENPT